MDPSFAPAPHHPSHFQPPYHQQSRPFVSQPQQQSHQQPSPYQQQQQQQGPTPVASSPYPPDPRQRFPGPQQSVQNQWNGVVGSAYPAATSGMNVGNVGIAPSSNGMAPPNMMQQQQQRLQAGMPQNAFTSAAYPQNTPTSAAPKPYPSTPQSIPQPSRRPANTMSGNSTPNQPTNIQTSQPVGTGSQQNTPQSATAPPVSMLSPAERSRQQKRVQSLLEMNSEILCRLLELQKEGQAGKESVGVPTKPEEMQDGQKPSESYIDLIKCLQSNLAYLANNQPGHAQKAEVVPPNGPAIMSAPSTLPELNEYYVKLKPLFPDWKGAPARPSPTQGNTQLPAKQATANTAAT